MFHPLNCLLNKARVNFLCSAWACDAYLLLNTQILLPVSLCIVDSVLQTVEGSTLSVSWHRFDFNMWILAFSVVGVFVDVQHYLSFSFACSSISSNDTQIYEMKKIFSDSALFSIHLLSPSSHYSLGRTCWHVLIGLLLYAFTGYLLLALSLETTKSAACSVSLLSHSGEVVTRFLSLSCKDYINAW